MRRRRVPAAKPRMSRLGEAGEEATSGASIRPASEPVMDNESERMDDASVDRIHLTNPEVRGAALTAGGALVPFFQLGTGEPSAQHSDGPVMSERQNPHGVESGPKAGKRNPSEPENLIAAPLLGVAKATGDRRNEGRSLHSSPRTGKPSTRRREAVDTACRQEEGSSGPVNIGFILNMQRKLYRWSRWATNRDLIHHARRAGCLETCTSGSERGVQRPAPARG